MGLWPSRGQYLHGFELKISRSDWQHELKKPEKAEAIAKYCDMFSLVISDMSVIDVSEVPKTWGIMVAQNGTVKTVREAPLLKSEPLSRDFLCGLLRKFTEGIERQYTPTVEVENIIEQRVKEGLDLAVGQASRFEKQYNILKQNLKKFEETSGLNLANPVS